MQVLLSEERRASLDSLKVLILGRTNYIHCLFCMQAGGHYLDFKLAKRARQLDA